MGGAEAYRAAGEGPGLEGLDSLFPGMPASLPLHLSFGPVTAGCEVHLGVLSISPVRLRTTPKHVLC